MSENSKKPNRSLRAIGSGLSNYLQSNIISNSSLTQQAGVAGGGGNVGGPTVFSSPVETTDSVETYDMNIGESVQYNIPQVEETESKTDNNNEVSLEMNDINKSRCMTPLIKVINKMYKMFKIKWESGGHSFMPNFLINLKDVISNSALHKNIRLFILQLIINKPVSQIISQWSDQWFVTILSVGSEELLNNKHNNFHYLYEDICDLFLIEWSNNITKSSISMTSSERSCCQNFINKLLSISFDMTRSKLRLNISLISNLLMKWNNTNSPFHIDTSYLLTLLQTPEG